jgi:hypothetical protein
MHSDTCSCASASCILVSQGPTVTTVDVNVKEWQVISHFLLHHKLDVWRDAAKVAYKCVQLVWTKQTDSKCITAVQKPAAMFPCTCVQLLRLIVFPVIPGYNRG